MRRRAMEHCDSQSTDLRQLRDVVKRASGDTIVSQSLPERSADDAHGAGHVHGVAAAEPEDMAEFEAQARENQ